MTEITDNKIYPVSRGVFISNSWMVEMDQALCGEGKKQRVFLTAIKGSLAAFGHCGSCKKPPGKEYLPIAVLRVMSHSPESADFRTMLGYLIYFRASDGIEPEEL